MTIRLVVYGVLSAILLSGPVQAQTKAGINFMAGPDGSTSEAVVKDIAQLAEECGLPPVVNQTQGGLENLLAVKNNRYTQFGIMQADVINYLRTFETVDPSIARTLQGINLAFPLYTEEIHLVAGAEITSLKDLDGKTVSIGDRDSGTFLTSTVIMNLAGIQPASKKNLTPEQSLNALLAGEIDAFFIVDGAPSRVFDGVDLVSGAFHLVSLEDPLLAAVYQTAVIEAGTYPFTPDPVPVLKVGTVMITYDYTPRGRNAYHTYNCEMIASVTRLVHDNIADLATIGHPKWVEVDPKAAYPDLELSRCAKLALEPDFKPVCTTE